MRDGPRLFLGPAMRSFRDRLRHAISFEILGLLMITPLAALFLHHDLSQIGVVTLGSATIAMIWTYIFNWGFDLALDRLTGSTRKGALARVANAVLFELGLLAVLMPFIAWWLQITLWQALVLDLAFAGFYLVYALIFNWAYDRIFPLPEWRQAT